ncbi:PEGA domain-containing protein [Candidatus Microgenomates bacterium]|nr:MAG: PEGA domain-containing protein [Candidatus Microgenomates bacterium]
MKRIIIIIVLLIIIGIVGFMIYRARSTSSAEAVLKIHSTPAATIFLNNETIGKTPYEEKVDAGEYDVKLIPETPGSISWEGKVTLSPNVLTYINRELKDTELTSAGEIVSLEKTSGSDAEISIISVPDGGLITIDGSERGRAPLVVRDLPAGNYEVAVSSLGFASRSVKVKTTAGYRVNVNFNLASTGVGGEVTPSPSPEPSDAPTSSPGTKTASPSPKASGSVSQGSPPPRPYIEISDTPTGFLRVRATPSGEEVGRVSPGEYYALLDEENGWFQIEYTEGEEGWVSGQYATKFE